MKDFMSSKQNLGLPLMSFASTVQANDLDLRWPSKMGCRAWIFSAVICVA